MVGEISSILVTLFEEHIPSHQYKISKNGELTELYLDGKVIDQLAYFPTDYTVFEHLKVLVIQSQTERFVKQIDFSLMPNLRMVSIASNKLTTIPDTILQLEFLEKLYVGGNKLEVVPRRLLERNIYENSSYTEHWLNEKRWKDFHEQVVNYLNRTRYDHIIPYVIFLKNKWIPLRYSLILWIPVLVMLSMVALFGEDAGFALAMVLLVVIIIFLVLIAVGGTIDVEQPVPAKPFSLILAEIGFPFLRRTSAVKKYHSQGEINIKSIPLIIEWIYSGDWIYELGGLQLALHLDAKTKELSNAVTYLSRMSKIEETRGIAKQVHEKLENIPLLDDPFFESEDDTVVFQDEGYHRNFLDRIFGIYKLRNLGNQDLQDNFTEMVESRRCCKLNGRTGDQYCGICGRVIPEEFIKTSQS